jgi:flavin reductase (DIM6/NTAB) family NADH-FMN oxidoreductase RutF
MQHINAETLASYERFYRGNLINSITGYKSANLLATRSKDDIDNVAIFSSVTHLGSDPALFSFVQRPLNHGVGHTYYNLKETGYITLNHVNMDLVERAHQSSAKYEAHTSEFEKLKIPALHRDGFHAPFVAASTIQVAATYENEYVLKENNCILVICRITDIFLNDGILKGDGWLNLEQAGTVTINGLDGYATGQTQNRLSYAQTTKKLTQLPLDN